MKQKILSLAAALLSLAILLCACTTGTPSATNAPTTNPPTTNAPATNPPATEPPATEPPATEAEDYNGKLVFDHKMELDYAKCFSVDYYKGGYKLAKLSDGTKMLIVPEKMQVPADLEEGTIVLQQPINNILVSSTPVTSLINAVGKLDAISLTTYDVDSWYIENVKQALTDGKMTYIGNYKEPDFEKITASGTKFAIFSTMLTEDVGAQLKQLGVDVILDMSADEEHPLARVEWAKLYGAMFNCEEKAEEVYGAQKANIDRIAQQEKTGKTVAVFYITSKGVLYARNADDYISKMVNLAGGQYALSDVGVGESGTKKMEMEAFYEKAKDADYIVYIWSLGGKPAAMSDFLERAAVLADMKAVKDGNVWCTTPDFFQIQNTIGDMVSDLRGMMEADASTDKLTYLFRLK